MSKKPPELIELKQLNLDLALRLERYEQQLRRLQLINKIAKAANDTSAPHEAVRQTLEQVCLSAGWPLAHAYFTRQNEERIELFSSCIWHIAETGNFDEFIRLSESLRFKPGQGLPGIVLRDREALWTNAIRSDAKRFALGRKVGIQSAFDFPVMMGDKVVAVLEFFSGQNLAPDEILLDIVAQVGMLLGRVFERAYAAEERALLNEQLIKASRRAGMAEVAAGVLHDVGNVLNSITVSSGLLKEQLGKKNINRVSKIAGLLRENENNLAEFLSRKKHGNNVIDYIEQLAQQLIDEQNFFSRELNALLNNVDHVNDIIHRQQSHAIPSSAKQNVNLNQVIDDVLKVNNLQDQVHGISVQTELADIPSLYIDKHNLIQILNNLVSNAKQAFEGKTENPVIQIKTVANPQNETATITITDNGCGITKDNQARIFQFGFTTKEGGHGFGLYTSASAAQSMGGRLSFSSKGHGHGTSFMLTLPYKPGRSSKGEIAA